jgi:inorganic pyrophosphatase
MDDPAIYLALLGSEVEVVVDRPLGSIHPEIPSLKYQTNYGYVPETLAGDGEEIDAYILGVEEPLKRFRGTCIAVILRKNDDENKIVVAPQKLDMQTILDKTSYVERDFETEIIVEGGA